MPLIPVVLTIVGAITVPLLVGLGARWSAKATISELEAQNALLRMENASYREATGQLASQISSLQTAVDEIGARARVDPAAQMAINRLPERVRVRAMGGGSVTAPLLSGAFPDQAFTVLRDLLSVMEKRLLSVRSGVVQRQALAAATPSMWPIAGWITSSYGSRPDPFNGEYDFHPGLDISANYGQDVFAPADGIVESAAASGNYGNLLTINHGFGITTRYGHLSKFAVTSGEAVRRGQIIGHVGSTGRSKGPHLHYEVLVNGQLTNPLRLLAGR
jgi:murein DD-endopeptidase MepM/ murein hydrolase activator NlpD